MTDTNPCKILVIDDDEESVEICKNALSRGELTPPSFEIDSEQDFEQGLRRFMARECDIVILDVRRGVDDPLAGQQVADAIRSTRFTPVIFWTAIPEKVSDQESSFVRVVPKNESSKLAPIVKQMVDEGLITASQTERIITSVLRDFMWNEVLPHWKDYASYDDGASIGSVVGLRASQVMAARSNSQESAAPSLHYVYPPTSEQLQPADVMIRQADGTWWLNITPACDLVLRSKKGRKAEYALLALGHDITTLASENKAESECQSGIAKFAKLFAPDTKLSRWNDLWSEMTDTRGRYIYLPAFRDIPHLVVDLQHTKSVLVTELDTAYKRVATLNSPWAEASLVQHSQYFGRVGTPDFDKNVVKSQLQSLNNNSDDSDK